MPISPGITFLMYRYGRPLALVYIRRTLAGEEGGTTTDQGFYRSWWHHLRSRATQRGRKVKGRSLLAPGSSDPMREAGAPSTSGKWKELCVLRSVVHAPPGIVMVAPQTLLHNALIAQI
jgi:hypothetical protein